jgi:hypothetical protein
MQKQLEHTQDMHQSITGNIIGFFFFFFVACVDLSTRQPDKKTVVVVPLHWAVPIPIAHAKVKRPNF